MTPAITRLRYRLGELFGRRRVQQILLGAYVWLCFVKVPATSVRDSAPQSWEAVLAFAAANRLQWGSDLVFTFGPLGFLTSDYYWGYLLPAIVLWSLGFALVLTSVFLPFWRRTAPSSRYPLLAALPLLTVPLCSDLGFDAIYLLSITLSGVACLPTERPSGFRTVATGLMLALLSAIKFSFSIYGCCAVLVIVIANSFAGRWRATSLLLSSCVVSFLAIWWSCGQKLSGLPLFLRSSLQLTSGYSSAMALSPGQWDRVFGLLVLFCLVALLLSCWLGSQDWKRNTDRVAVVALGIFLAWKEGFVRADVHVVVFFVYAFLLAALLPSLLNVPVFASGEASNAPAQLAPLWRFHFRWLPRLSLLLVTAVLLLALAPFASYRKSFGRAVQSGFVPRFSDTFVALTAPGEYQRRLEDQLEVMRLRVHLPRIKAAVAGARVGVLNYHQDVAVLNGLNYVPHPVFQSYSAYTPELQRLNTAFFNSDRAPEYVVWRPGTVDKRAPTLDDGEVLLRILNGYHPVLQEDGFVLWRQNSTADESYTFVRERNFSTAFEHWFSVTNQPLWCRIDLRSSALGVIESLLWNCCEVRLEVQLEDGKTRDFRLLPGNARHGFLLNPLLLGNADVLRPGGKSSAPPRVVAARVHVEKARMFDRAVKVDLLTIAGLPRLQSPPIALGPSITGNEN